MSDRQRVIIVGGGVIGVSTAYALARRGAEVELVERQKIGAGASGGNAGTIAVGHPPLNRPGRFTELLRWITKSSSPLYVKPRVDPSLWRWLLGFYRYCTHEHVQHAMSVMAPLGHDALQSFERLLSEEQIKCGYRAGGYLEVCSTESALDHAHHEAALISEYGYKPELIDGDELRLREPALGPDRIGAVHYHESATLSPSAFLSGLTKASRRYGVRFHTGAGVTQVNHKGDKVTGVTLDSGKILNCDTVVLATGTYSKKLPRAFGLHVPVQPGKGYHREVAIGSNGAPNLRIACVLAEHAVFCTPMRASVRFAGTMEFSGENNEIRPDRLNQLTIAAREAFPHMGTAQPHSEWCGLRPMSIDGLPIIGFIPGIEGLVLATGHGMLGLTLGPVTGDIVANQVLDGSDPRATHLSPARFASRKRN